jgi:hypothetical protein
MTPTEKCVKDNRNNRAALHSHRLTPPAKAKGAAGLRGAHTLLTPPATARGRRRPACGSGYRSDTRFGMESRRKRLRAAVISVQGCQVAQCVALLKGQ